MPNQPKPDKAHIERIIEGMDKVFRKGQHMPETPGQVGGTMPKPNPPKPDEKPKK